MSSTSVLSATISTRKSRRQRFASLVTAVTIALIVLACPFGQNARAHTSLARHAAPYGLFSRTVFARSSVSRSPRPVHALNAGYWHAEGSRILTNAGAPVRIAGVNWSGLETTNMVPGGLTQQDYRSLLRSVRAAGYNTVRIPFSNQMIESPIVPSNIAFENGAGGKINTDLEGLDSLAILDRIVAAAGEAGLKVILDNHRSESGSSAQASGLWYTDEYPESVWIADWTSLAARYKGNSTVVGFDLRNEPHNATKGGACWSCGGATDWHLAAERAGNAVLRVNPSLLIFVEGTDTVGSESDFWGGNLAGVRTAPVRLSVPGRLVYSAHVYGPTEYQQSWFNAGTTPASLAALYQRHWGFISDSGIAPVWIGEFGTPNTDEDVRSSEPGSEGQWFSAFVAYLGSHSDIGWTYWGINGEDRYGLLSTSYTGPANPLKAQALASIRLPRSAGFELAATRTGSARTAVAPTTFASSYSPAAAPATFAGSYGTAVAVPVTTPVTAAAIYPVTDPASYPVAAAPVSHAPVRSAARSAARSANSAAVEGSVAEQVRLATARALGNLPGQSE